MIKFMCAECDYRFEAEISRGKCPYCGKKTVIKEPGAEDLLKDS